MRACTLTRACARAGLCIHFFFAFPSKWMEFYNHVGTFDVAFSQFRRTRAHSARSPLVFPFAIGVVVAVLIVPFDTVSQRLSPLPRRSVYRPRYLHFFTRMHRSRRIYFNWKSRRFSRRFPTFPATYFSPVSTMSKSRKNEVALDWRPAPISVDLDSETQLRLVSSSRSSCSVKYHRSCFTTQGEHTLRIDRTLDKSLDTRTREN